MPLPGHTDGFSKARHLGLLLATPSAAGEAAAVEVVHRAPVLQLLVWGQPRSRPQLLFLVPSGWWADLLAELHLILTVIRSYVYL